MSGSNSRREAISAVTKYKPISEPLNFAETPARDLYGTNVFGPDVMRDRLPKNVFKAVTKTIEQGEKLEETAADMGWGVSPSLSPGSLVGWSLRGQRELCGLLPLESIGVELNTHCVLEPHKSTSGIIGLGPGYETNKVGSACKYCALQNTCWRRRRDPS